MKQEITQKLVYDLSQQTFGVVPGIIKEMAEHSVHTAWLYANGIAGMQGASFYDQELNAIELKISLLNNCASCIKGHSFLLKKVGMSDADVDAILSGAATSNERINVLIKASEYIYHSGSDIYPDHVLSYFEDQNLSDKEIMDIVGIISLKTISNFINNYLESVKHRQVAASVN